MIDRDTTHIELPVDRTVSVELDGDTLVRGSNGNSINYVQTANEDLFHTCGGSLKGFVDENVEELP